MAAFVFRQVACAGLDSDAFGPSAMANPSLRLMAWQPVAPFLPMDT